MSIQVTTLSNPILSIDRRRNNRALQSSAFAVLRVHWGAGDLLPHLKGLLASDSHSSVVYPGGIARGVVDSDCLLREIVQRQSGEPAMCRHRGRRPVTAVRESIRSFGVFQRLAQPFDRPLQPPPPGQCHGHRTRLRRRASPVGLNFGVLVDDLDGVRKLEITAVGDHEVRFGIIEPCREVAIIAVGGSIDGPSQASSPEIRADWHQAK